MVNCTPDFVDQPKVINGYSDLMMEVFGDPGREPEAPSAWARSPAISPSRSRRSSR